MPGSKPSWVPDPQDATQLRYWTGSGWSEYRLARPEGWAASSADGTNALGGLAWWQTWWFIVPGLVLCLPVGLVGLWRRPSLSMRSRLIGTLAALVLLIAVVFSEDPAPTDPPPTASEPTSESASPEPAPSETEPESVEVPDLAGLKRARAVRQLRELGLMIDDIRRVPSARPSGAVLRQSLRTGAVIAAGSSIALVVAAPLPRVPDVVGVGAGRARQLIREAGFAVSTVTESVTSGSDGSIIRQTPVGGDRVKPSSDVQLVVADFVPPPEPVAPPADDCATGYDPCLPPLSDYDCAGGSGDGPGYAEGPIYVTGSDPYDLDSEGDGVACEI